MKKKIITVCWITLAWACIAVYQFADLHVTLLTERAIGPDYDAFSVLQTIIVSVTLGGLLGGSAIVFLWEKWLRGLNFKLAMFLIVLCYSMIYMSLLWLSIESIVGQNTFRAQQILEQGGVFHAVFNPTIIPNYVFWLAVMLATLFLLFVRDRFGPGMLGSYIMGKYFRPVREEKVVMFLDLKDSTQIAENLGAERYFTFLNKVFQVVTSPILDTDGQIYQYVGDEIVLTWNHKDAARNANCLQCFWKISNVLAENADAFDSMFGCKPAFKAGINAGIVVAGEVGVIKREVVYSGDVLNTAARIRGLCNELDHDLLISESVFNMLDRDSGKIDFHPKGAFELRGKVEPVNVYAPIIARHTT